MRFIVQLLKPVSSLAWLPLVTMVAAALYTARDPLFSKAFLTSAIIPSLCCLWLALTDTAVGVSKDLINVRQVLCLVWLTKTRQIVLPCSVPIIFRRWRPSRRLRGKDGNPPCR